MKVYLKKPERNFRLFYVLFLLFLSPIPGKIQKKSEYQAQFEKSKKQFKWVNHKLYETIFEESKKLGIKDHAHFIACLIQAESEGNPRALGRKTRYGRARGLMQIMHFHVSKKDLHRLYDPKFNIRLGIKIFHSYLRGRRGNLVEALKDYNSGPASVYYNRPYIRKILRNYGR